MSRITTKRGDDGKTDLFLGGRLPKHHPVFDLVGTLDELSAHITMARSLGLPLKTAEETRTVQSLLIELMGEMASMPGVEERQRIKLEHITQVESFIDTLEKAGHDKGWLQPDGRPSFATLDIARTVCRRAERIFSQLQDLGWVDNKHSLILLNRLSDWLWLAANQKPPAAN